MDLALYDPGSATTPAPPSDRGARAIFLPASTSGRSSASCSRSRSPRWPALARRPTRPASPLRSRRGRRRQRPALGRHPARRSTRRSPGSTSARGCTSSRRAQPRARAQHGDARRRRDRLAGRFRRPASRLVRRRALRQRAARRAAGAPGRHARRRAARGLRRGRRRAASSTAKDRRRRRRSQHTSRDLGVTLEPGWRAEISLARVDWIRDAARRLRRGFMILIDYGHEARELYSVTHAAGTLTSFTATPWPGREVRHRQRPAGCSARRAGHHGPRRLHERQRRGRGRRAADARLPRSDVLPDGSRRLRGSAESESSTTSRTPRT